MQAAAQATDCVFTCFWPSSHLPLEGARPHRECQVVHANRIAISDLARVPEEVANLRQKVQQTIRFFPALCEYF